MYIIYKGSERCAAADRQFSLPAQDEERGGSQCREQQHLRTSHLQPIRGGGGC